MAFTKDSTTEQMRTEIQAQRDKVVYGWNLLVTKGPMMTEEEYLKAKTEWNAEDKLLRSMTKKAEQILKKRMRR